MLLSCNSSTESILLVSRNLQTVIVVPTYDVIYTRTRTVCNNISRALCPHSAIFFGLELSVDKNLKKSSEKVYIRIHTSMYMVA